MSGEIQLEQLHGQLAVHRRRMRHGLLGLTVAGASFVACRLVLWWALAFVLVFTVGFFALALGVIWSIGGVVKAGMTVREIRRLRQLPEARVIDR